MEISSKTMEQPLTILGQAGAASADAEKIPLYESPASCGYPAPAEDDVLDNINLHNMCVKNPPATFFMRAAGDSMIGLGIHNNDLLVVDRSQDATHNRVVIAAVEGELVVKKLVRRKGRVLLVPANPAYPEIDITDREYVHVWGVVTWVVHKV